MQSIAKGLGLGSAAMALTALTALAWPGTAGAAPSATESLYAPSALVLGITAGEDTATGTVLRAVTLVCAPTPGGTHPSPAAACTELQANAGRLDALTERGSSVPCTKEWNPMTVTADGVWQGRRLNYSYTFGNPCGLRHTSGALFGF
ncbi:subtilase-type protease inhibitor [Streptomyces sp. APSN-46.1]|uniref:subtilase-type protease inhibitor n=1 Tax=Streptomyces sp. APSN-46.1 TaxID=2929049 RepID=UPI001FB217BD|nr:subtilase-type protease inhibitor [Streptomyces sp. APSN-46.1]MCJ1676746.1 subtilase-type protease inhibitor [Streptomyces sp. APSN-46.1]